MKRIIFISGKARHGKDTVASILKEELEAHGERVLITHYGDAVKYVAKTFFGWNGEKDEAGRSLLQEIGTNQMRSYNPDFWRDFVCGILNCFSYEWDYVLIPDVRFSNELFGRNRDGAEAYHLRVLRPNFDNGLTEEQKNHISETDLDESNPDFLVINDGTLDDLKAFIRKYAPFYCQDSVDGEWHER